jgi:hypothetical protein
LADATLANVKRKVNWPPKQRTFDRLHTPAHCFAFSLLVPGVRPCFEFPSGSRPAGSTTEPCDPTVGKTRNASDRLLPPVRKLRAPAPRAFPGHSATFAAWAPRGFWDPRGLTGGPGVSHRPRSALAGRAPTLLEPRVLSVAGGGSRAWALSSHGAGSTEPLTSLSPLPTCPCSHPFGRARVSRGLHFAVSTRWRLRVDRTGRKPPRPP